MHSLHIKNSRCTTATTYKTPKSFCAETKGFFLNIFITQYCILRFFIKHFLLLIINTNTPVQEFGIFAVFARNQEKICNRWKVWWNVIDFWHILQECIEWQDIENLDKMQRYLNSIFIDVISRVFLLTSANFFKFFVVLFFHSCCRMLHSCVTDLRQVFLMCL